MQTVTVTIPEHQANVGIVRSYIVTMPEIEHTYAPTLAEVHNWLHGDWGPFYCSWRDGQLCPFHPDVQRRNMTCCNGARKYCGGLLIERQHVNTNLRRIGHVICYEWDHVLSIAYWNIPAKELLALPDDHKLVAFHIMRRVFRATGWWDWRQEKKRRASKRKPDWLPGMPKRKPLPITV